MRAKQMRFRSRHAIRNRMSSHGFRRVKQTAVGRDRGEPRGCSAPITPGPRVRTDGDSIELDSWRCRPPRKADRLEAGGVRDARRTAMFGREDRKTFGREDGGVRDPAEQRRSVAKTGRPSVAKTAGLPWALLSWPFRPDGDASSFTTSSFERTPRAVHWTPRAVPLGFVVFAFQAGWRRIKIHNVVIRKDTQGGASDTQGGAAGLCCFGLSGRMASHRTSQRRHSQVMTGSGVASNRFSPSKTSSFVSAVAARR